MSNHLDDRPEHRLSAVKAIKEYFDFDIKTAELFLEALITTSLIEELEGLRGKAVDESYDDPAMSVTPLPALTDFIDQRIKELKG